MRAPCRGVSVNKSSADSSLFDNGVSREKNELSLGKGSVDAKITVLSGEKPNKKNPVIVLIPGGPGLSSRTWGDISYLRKTHDVVLVDPPGTNGLAEEKKYSFAEVVTAIEIGLGKLSSRLALVGHSFGGFYAISLAARGQLSLSHLVIVSCPLSVNSHSSVNQQALELPGIAAAIQTFQADPSNANLSAWLQVLAPLYFPPERLEAGKKMLREDKLSAIAFLQIYTEVFSSEHAGTLLEQFSFQKIPKFMIAGALDKLLLPQMMTKDAEETGCKLGFISGAGHFPNFDNPKDFAARLVPFIEAS